LKPKKDSQKPESKKPTKPLSPSEIGTSIGQIYYESMASLTKLVKNLPPPNEIKQRVLDLKEATVQRLVVLGREREKLNPTDRQAVDTTTRIRANMINTNDFNVMQAANAHYMSQDLDFANTVSSFNIITQYAFFELLKKQLPAEAARLQIA